MTTNTNVINALANKKEELSSWLPNKQKNKISLSINTFNGNTSIWIEEPECVPIEVGKCYSFESPLLFHIGKGNSVMRSYKYTIEDALISAHNQWTKEQNGSKS